jgi:radical SAM/Cys-rich protein
MIDSPHAGLAAMEKMMNAFDARVAPVLERELRSVSVDTIQLNLGLRCNQACMHCHVSASPTRRETMPWAVMAAAIETAPELKCRFFDLTGGAPELNPNFRRLVTALGDADYTVQVRTNLTVLLQPECAGLAAFLAEKRVRLVASMPCYLQENVDRQRGDGVYAGSIAAIRLLNDLGYGSRGELVLNLAYNPGGPRLPGEQSSLESDYRRELRERHGLSFSRLLTIANMPIGRFRGALARERALAGYQKELESAWNPATLQGLMCRYQLSIDWNGVLHDCDFNLALSLPLLSSRSRNILDCDPRTLVQRRVATGDHCFGCTAGQGSSCRGALA